MKMPQEQEITVETKTETKLFREKISSDKGYVILVGARDVGPVRSLLPLIDALEKSSVYYLVDGAATEELLKKRDLEEVKIKFVAQALELNPHIVMTAGEVSTAIADTLTYTYEGEGLPVTVWLEDVPNSLRNRRGIPDLVFCLNDASGDNFIVLHPDIPKDRIMVSRLNPDFLRLLEEDTEKIGVQTREALGIDKDAVVITFIGSKSSDIPNDPYVLSEVVEILAEIEKEKERQVVLIRRDHPGEPNPQLYDDSITGYQRHLIPMKKDSDLYRKFTTAQVCCASNILVGVSSTVFEESAYRGALKQQPYVWGTIVVTRLEKSANSPLIESGSALVATSRKDFRSQIRNALFNKETQYSIHSAQKKYADVFNMRANLDKVVKAIEDAVEKAKTY